MPNRAWSRPPGRRPRAVGPADRALGGVANHLGRVGQRHHVIQHHGHVAAQRLLDGDGPLRRNLQQPAVDVRAEHGLLVGHPGDPRQAEELKTAAIGEDRAVPAHETVQPAQGRHHLVARPQGQVIGVGQDHLAPVGASWSISRPLTLPRCPPA